MNKNLNKTVCLAVFLSIFTAAPSLVFAEHFCPISQGKMDGHGEKFLNAKECGHNGERAEQSFKNDDGKTMLFKKINLIFDNQQDVGITEEQLEKIKNLRNDTQKSLIMKDAEIEVNNIDLNSNMWEGDQNTQVLNGLIDKKFELKKDEAKAILNSFFSLRSILNDDQENQLNKMCGLREKIRKAPPADEQKAMTEEPKEQIDMPGSSTEPAFQRTPEAENMTATPQEQQPDVSKSMSDDESDISTESDEEPMQTNNSMDTNSDSQKGDVQEELE